LARRLGLALKNFASSTFYSDSHNDLPLLERVTRARWSSTPTPSSNPKPRAGAGE
jgi:phosphoserine phosphatase